MSDLSLMYKLKRATTIKQSPDGKYFAVSSTYVILMSSESKQALYKFNKFKCATTCTFSHDSKFLAIRSDLGKVLLFSLDRMEVVSTYAPSHQEGSEILFSPDDKHLIVSDWNGKIFKIDIEKGRVFDFKSYPGYMIKSARYDAEHGKILFLISHIIADGQTALNSTGQDLFVEWDYFKGDDAIKEYRINGTVAEIIYNAVRKIYFVLRYNSFKIYNEDFEKESDIYNLEPKEFIYTAACSSDGRYLAIILSAKWTLLIYEWSSQLTPVKKCLIDNITHVQFIMIEGEECLFLGAYDEGSLYNFKKFLEDPEFA